MTLARKLLKDMNDLPIGGAIVVMQPSVDTTDDVMVYRKTAPNTWERLPYPFTQGEPVSEATVGWEALLVGSVQALLPKPGARLTDFTFLRKSVERAFATEGKVAEA